MHAKKWTRQKIQHFARLINQDYRLAEMCGELGVTKHALASAAEVHNIRRWTQDDSYRKFKTQADNFLKRYWTAKRLLMREPESLHSRMCAALKSGLAITEAANSLGIRVAEASEAAMELVELGLINTRLAERVQNEVQQITGGESFAVPTGNEENASQRILDKVRSLIKSGHTLTYIARHMGWPRRAVINIYNKLSLGGQLTSDDERRMDEQIQIYCAKGNSAADTEKQIYRVKASDLEGAAISAPAGLEIPCELTSGKTGSEAGKDFWPMIKQIERVRIKHHHDGNDAEEKILSRAIDLCFRYILEQEMEL